MNFHRLFLRRQFLIESFDFLIELLRCLIDFRTDSRDIRLVLFSKSVDVGFDVGNPGIEFRLVGPIAGVKFAVLFLKSGDVPFMGCLNRFQFCLMPCQLFAQSDDLFVQLPIGIAQAIDFGVQFRFQTGKAVIQLPDLLPIPVFSGKLLLTQIGHGAVDFVVQRRILLVDLRLQRGNITRMCRFQIRNPAGQQQLIQLQSIDFAFKFPVAGRICLFQFCQPVIGPLQFRTEPSGFGCIFGIQIGNRLFEQFDIRLMRGFQRGGFRINPAPDRRDIAVMLDLRKFQFLPELILLLAQLGNLAAKRLRFLIQPVFQLLLLFFKHVKSGIQFGVAIADFLPNFLLLLFKLFDFIFQFLVGRGKAIFKLFHVLRELRDHVLNLGYLGSELGIQFIDPGIQCRNILFMIRTKLILFRLQLAFGFFQLCNPGFQLRFQGGNLFLKLFELLQDRRLIRVVFGNRVIQLLLQLGDFTLQLRSLGVQLAAQFVLEIIKHLIPLHLQIADVVAGSVPVDRRRHHHLASGRIVAVAGLRKDVISLNQLRRLDQADARRHLRVEDRLAEPGSLRIGQVDHDVKIIVVEPLGASEKGGRMADLIRRHRNLVAPCRPLGLVKYSGSMAAEHDSGKSCRKQ